MDWLIVAGSIITLIGVAGLMWCGIRANKLRVEGLEGEELAAQLRTLIPVNVASLGFSGIGLAMVVVGILI